MAPLPTKQFTAAMLDWSHNLVLRAVADDSDSDHSSPALDDLVAVGFVTRSAGATRITDTGRTALELGVPSRRERWALRITAGSAGFLALASVGERLF